MLSAERYCELLDGRCGELAVVTVEGVHACAEHARALRRIVARRVCPECQRNLAGRGGQPCTTCKRERRRRAA